MPSTVVVLLSQDDDLTEALPEGLAIRDPEIEVQVVPTVASLLSHVDRLQPDAMVIDAHGIAEAELEALLREGPGADVPTIVLDSGLAETRRDELLAAGATSFVARDPSYIDRLGDEVLRTRRVVTIANRGGEAEQHYLNILEASSDGIFVLIGGVFRYLNSSFEEAIGIVAEDLLDHAALLSLVADEDARAVSDKLGRVEATSGAGELIEMRLDTPRGQLVFEVSCRASVVDGQRAVVGVARDVTEVRRLQREVEQARERAAHIERLRALGELAAGVAHDFNNALGTILGRLRIAREKQQRLEPVLEELEVIQRAADNAAETVKRIQRVSRPVGGETWEDVDLMAVVRDATEFVRTRVPVEVTLEVSLDPTPAIRGNGEELREVLLNLLNNALDSVVPGGRVKIGCGVEEDRAVVTVEDDGCGMSPEVQKRVFEPFFSTKASSGTGLGLSVSHWILRRHDARIELTSEPGQGTRFRLSFAPFESAPRHTPQLAKTRLSILVVDDDASVAELMSDLLTEHGHGVRVVDNAEDAYAALAEETIDLVISDLDLPDASGWEISRHVREVQPDAVFGLVTGWPLDATDEELRARGVDFSLSKPFTFEAFKAAVDGAQRKG